ncbi:cytochrome P450 [Periconia macrospinosa]|uniref:Cytochrome P450 n=1 Tax=Periconia macrospinosa TaxID=97972 RepID=A0A2V1DSZ2_9PLEO|nr:cytochrome P450 [Periconia macrospinosa]
MMDTLLSSKQNMSAVLLLATVIWLLITALVPKFVGPKSRRTILNSQRLFEFSSKRIKKEFWLHGTDMMREWFKSNPGKPVEINTDVGRTVLLPPEFADEIRNEKNFSLSAWSTRSYHAHLPGFEGFREESHSGVLMQRVITKHLTQRMAHLIQPLAEESSLGLHDLFPTDPGWHSVHLREQILAIAARVSSRTFVGKEMCRNERWLKIAREYTVAVFTAAADLRRWPCILRPIVNMFLPSCCRAQVMMKEATLFVQKIAKGRNEAEKDSEANTESSGYALEWLEQEANGSPYDPAAALMMLSMVTIHTTADLLCQTIIDIAQHPETLKALREEISSVVYEHGWQKLTLYQLKLLDSVIKESQRIKPLGSVSMRRLALETVTLSDGTVIHKGQSLAVSSHSMWDENIYSEPEKWKGSRFLNQRRNEDKQHVSHLVSTSPQHLGFGHGEHACPGRFFAANEMKIILAKFLMIYDFELPTEVSPKVRKLGFSMSVDPTLQMRIRNRLS